MRKTHPSKAAIKKAQEMTVDIVWGRRDDRGVTGGTDRFRNRLDRERKVDDSPKGGELINPR